MMMTMVMVIAIAMAKKQLYQFEAAATQTCWEDYLNWQRSHIRT